MNSELGIYISMQVFVTLSSCCFMLFFTALADGALDPVLTMCALKEAIALLALMTLSHIVEHQGNLAPLIEVSMGNQVMSK